MKRGDLIYLPTKSGRYRQYRVLSWHPEFKAATCVSKGKPVILGTDGALSESQNQARLDALNREKWEAKYGGYLDVFRQLKDSGWEGVKAAFPNECIGALWNKWRACQRRGLIERT